MAVTLKLRKGTIAQIAAQATANILVPGEPFFVTDQNRIGISLTTSTYELYAKVSELGGGAAVVKGSVLIDFGTTGNDEARVTVSAPTVLSDSIIDTQLDLAGTADNDADEHLLEPTIPKVSKITPGVSFEIAMIAEDTAPLFGKWLVDWKIT